jgi:hypothetical protein
MYTDRLLRFLYVPADTFLAVSIEHPRLWRPPEQRVPAMAGQTDRYVFDPRGEYVFGIAQGNAMVCRRGRERRLVQPGQLVAWDPSAAHSGSTLDGLPWTSRLLVVGLTALAQLASDSESDPLSGVSFPEPVLEDPRLVGGFLQLHHVLDAPSTRLEQDARLVEWLREVVEHSGQHRLWSVRSSRDDHSLRLAYEYLGAAWTTPYLADALETLRAEGEDVPEELIAHLSPVAWEPVNFLVRYTFDPANARPLDDRRPLRSADDEGEEAA